MEKPGDTAAFVGKQQSIHMVVDVMCGMLSNSL